MVLLALLYVNIDVEWWFMIVVDHSDTGQLRPHPEITSLSGDTQFFELIRYDTSAREVFGPKVERVLGFELTRQLRMQKGVTYHTPNKVFLVGELGQTFSNPGAEPFEMRN